MRTIAPSPLPEELLAARSPRAPRGLWLPPGMGDERSGRLASSAQHGENLLVRHGEENLRECRCRTVEVDVAIDEAALFDCEAEPL